MHDFARFRGVPRGSDARTHVPGRVISTDIAEESGVSTDADASRSLTIGIAELLPNLGISSAPSMPITPSSVIYAARYYTLRGPFRWNYEHFNASPLLSLLCQLYYTRGRCGASLEEH